MSFGFHYPQMRLVVQRVAAFRPHHILCTGSSGKKLPTINEGLVI